MDAHKVKVVVRTGMNGRINAPECGIWIDDKQIKLCQKIRFEMSVEDQIPRLTLHMIPDQVVIEGETCVCTELAHGIVFTSAEQGIFSGPKRGIFAESLVGTKGES